VFVFGRRAQNHEFRAQVASAVAAHLTLSLGAEGEGEGGACLRPGYLLLKAATRAALETQLSAFRVKVCAAMLPRPMVWMPAPAS
jgi:hypothetical protein